MTRAACILFLWDGSGLACLDSSAAPGPLGPWGGRPQPWYLVAAGLGAGLAHAEPQRGAG